MPPIKRTKFKLTHEQLLQMFYWLRLIRAFDERLSTLVKQGKVRSGVYTGIGQEAIVVGTCFAGIVGRKAAGNINYIEVFRELPEDLRRPAGHCVA